MKVKNNNIEMICSLSPLQEGILYHYLADESKTDYVVQYVFRCNGSLNQNLIRKTLEILSRKYENHPIYSNKLPEISNFL